MKGLFSPQEDKIVSYGVAYEEMSEDDNVYLIPDDYSFDTYNYQSITSGIFNPDGFVLIEKL